MALKESPVKVVDDAPVIEFDGMIATIPHDPGTEVSFRYSR
jgi:hypothetical protein